MRIVLAVLVMVLGGLQSVYAQAAADLPRYFLVHRDFLKAGRQVDFEATRIEYIGWTKRHATPPGERPVLFLVVNQGEQIWALRPSQTWADIAATSRSDSEVTDLVEKSVGERLEDNDRRMHDSIVRHHNELWAVRGQFRGQAPGNLAAAFAQAQWVLAYTPNPSAGDDTPTIEGALNRLPGWRWNLVSYLGSGQRLLMLGGATAIDDSQIKSLAAMLRENAVNDVDTMRVRFAPALSVLP